MFVHAIDCDMGMDCTCPGVCPYCAGEGRAEGIVCSYCEGSGADPEAELEPLTFEELDDLTSGQQ